MEAERHRDSTRSNRGGSKPVVQESEDRGSRGLEASASSRCKAQIERRAASAITGLVATGSRSLRFSWTGLDNSASGPVDRATIWGEVSSSPLQPLAPQSQV